MLHEPHAAYVVAAYVISAAGLAGLVVETLLRARRWKRAAGERNGRP